MNEEARELLEKEIVNCLNELADIRLEEERKDAAIDKVIKLTKLYNDSSKMSEEMQMERERFEIEKKKIDKDELVRLKDDSDKKKDRIIKIVLESSSIILPLIFYGIWMKRGFEFEENGSYTSTTFRNLFGQFKAKNR